MTIRQFDVEDHADEGGNEGTAQDHCGNRE